MTPIEANPKVNNEQLSKTPKLPQFINFGVNYGQFSSCHMLVGQSQINPKFGPQPDSKDGTSEIASGSGPRSDIKPLGYGSGDKLLENVRTSPNFDVKKLPTYKPEKKGVLLRKRDI